MSRLIDERLEERVAIITLAAPEKLNAISLEMRQALTEALQRRYLDDECSAIVICGSNGNFSSGGDIRGERPAPQALARTLRHKLSQLHQVIRLVMSSPKPIVSAVEGKAFGAGMSLAICCDVVVAAQTAQFCAAFGRVGLLPDAGILYTLPRRVGAARAQQMMLSARVVEAPEAQAMGLADHVVSTSELLPLACAEATRMASIAPLAFSAIKAMGTADCATLEDAFSQELRLQPLLAMTEDYAESRAAFAEKRKPRFRGR